MHSADYWQLRARRNSILAWIDSGHISQRPLLCMEIRACTAQSFDEASHFSMVLILSDNSSLLTLGDEDDCATSCLPCSSSRAQALRPGWCHRPRDGDRHHRYQPVFDCHHSVFVYAHKILIRWRLIKTMHSSEWIFAYPSGLCEMRPLDMILRIFHIFLFSICCSF